MFSNLLERSILRQLVSEAVELSRSRALNIEVDTRVRIAPNWIFAWLLLKSKYCNWDWRTILLRFASNAHATKLQIETLVLEEILGSIFFHRNLAFLKTWPYFFWRFVRVEQSQSRWGLRPLGVLHTFFIGFFQQRQGPLTVVVNLLDARETASPRVLSKGLAKWSRDVVRAESLQFFERRSSENEKRILIHVGF